MSLCQDHLKDKENAMLLKAYILCVYLLSLLYGITCVNISKLKEMNPYKNFSGIGPLCADHQPYESTCNLDNGKMGQCAELCIEPSMDDAKICCHERLPTILKVYFCCEVGDSIVRAVAVGGVRAENNEFPYMAALGWYKSAGLSSTYIYKCGGAFISYKFVLTAAHCAYIEGLEPIVVLPGGNNVSVYDADNEPYIIEAVHVHPNYDDDFSYNDIALIQIVGEHEGSTIDLWRRCYQANTSFTAVGYGDTTFGGTSSDVLLKVFLQHVPIKRCQRYYSQEDNVPNGIIKTQICAQDPKNIMDTCQGDSGGPLIMTTYNQSGDKKKEYLLGITSFGVGCASAAPGIYTRVATYTRWINEVMKPWRKTESIDDKKDKIYWT